MSMLPLQPILERKFKRTGLKLFFDAHEVLRVFGETVKEILPEEIFREISPISYRNGIIKIHSAHPIISMEFRVHESEILSLMHKKNENFLIKRIIIEQ